MSSEDTKIGNKSDDLVISYQSTLNGESSIESSRPDFTKFKSMKFETSRKRFDDVSSLMIFFQGIFRFYAKFNWLLSFVFCSCYKLFTKVKGVKSDSIEVSRQDPVTMSDLNNFFGSSDVATGAVIDLVDLESVTELTDSMFRSACIQAHNTCAWHSYIFMIMNKTTGCIESFATIVLPVAMYINFGDNEYTASICVIVPFLFARVIFDWSVLMEKYAIIAHEFENLSSSKEETRVDLYESLVNRYRSSWLYSDSIKIKLL